MTLVANKLRRTPPPPYIRAVQTGGPAALDNTDRQRFADQLDRFLRKIGVRPQ